MYQDPNLPCGVTTAMCDNSGGEAMDENTSCGCGHILADHTNDDDKEPCMVDDCECNEFTDDWEPDWDSKPGGADDPDRVRR